MRDGFRRIAARKQCRGFWLAVNCELLFGFVVNCVISNLCEYSNANVNNSFSFLELRFTTALQTKKLGYLSGIMYRGGCFRKNPQSILLFLSLLWHETADVVPPPDFDFSVRAAPSHLSSFSFLCGFFLITNFICPCVLLEEARVC